MPEIIVDSGSTKGQRVPLEDDSPFTVGRDGDNTVNLLDALVSRQHARISPSTNGSFEVEDLRSANGTYLNGQRLIARQRLADGDRIQLGESVLTFFEAGGDDPLIGKTISGFEVLERVGSGGMGTVYKARQVSLDRAVALKVLSRELGANRKFTEAFHREARAAGQINHGSIVQVYDVDTVQLDGEEVTFFAMEYMSEGSVEDLLGKDKKRIPIERALEIALDTARGLQFAEKFGLVHRDIKPGNLMVGESGIVKIGDLGIARRSEGGNKVTQSDGISGSPHYISPEQARGLDLDTRADIYSLGVTLYHVVAGRPPFVGSNAKKLILQHLRDDPPPIESFRSDVPRAVVAVIERMMQKDPERRFGDAGALVTALDEVQRKLKEQPRMPGVRARLVRSARRSWLRWASLVALLLVGSAIGFALLEIRNNRRQTESRATILSLELTRIVTDIEEALRDGEVARARSIFDEQLDEQVPPEFVEHEKLANVLRDTAILRQQIEDKEDKVRQRQLEKKLVAELDALLKNTPTDLNAPSSLEPLRSLARKMMSFSSEHAGTEAAKTAAAKKREFQAAINGIGDLLHRSQSTYQTTSSKVATLTSVDPPNYKDALQALKAFLDGFPTTPEATLCRKLVVRTQQEMEEAATRWVREARGQKSEAAIRRLRQFRKLVEGEAREKVEKALKELEKR